MPRWKGELANARELRRRAREAGLCSRCHSRLPMPGYLRCGACHEIQHSSLQTFRNRKKLEKNLENV